MRVFLTGGTGLIGRSLVRALVQRGDVPVVLSRRPESARSQPAMAGAEIVAGDPATGSDWFAALDGCDAVVNLAGENLFAERWSRPVLDRIRESRVQATTHLVAAIERATHRPRVLVSGSATGYYGPHGAEELTESSPPGADLLAQVCVDWERAAEAAEPMGVRVVRVRTGLVLARDEGALATMIPVFKWVPGGAAPVGSGGGLFARGPQYLSWIHLDDIVGLFLLALDRPEASGPINGTAPTPVTNRDFSRALARAVRRPFFPFGPPDFLLKLVVGQAAEVLTTGQRVLPKRALELGYRFRFPDLKSAFEDLFSARGATSRPASA